MITFKYDSSIFSYNKIEVEKEVILYQLTCKKQKLTEIEISLPATGIAYQWHPLKGFDSSLKPDWIKNRSVSLIESAPVECFYDYEGNNKLTLACDELVNEMKFKSGIREEDGYLVIKVTFLPREIDHIYNFYVDTNSVKYYTSLKRVSKWWESKLSLFPVKSDYRKTMYSTWYSYHQELNEIELLNELEEIKNCDFSTIILDDGWQTSDVNRGYGYAGDWEVTPDKFNDFEKFVQKCHHQDLAVMVWFSVPYIGENTNKWEVFKEKLIYHDLGRRAGILDIRYQENIDYLVNTYLDFSKKYNIDGLKLDFIDEFYLRKDSPVYNSDMAYDTVLEALEIFLQTLKEKLLSWKSDFFVEFRQKYIGPGMRQYANAFRVVDCPYSAISNRVGLIDMRLINGTTPAHSDMLMWHKDDVPESVALQIIACLFGTIQFSIKLYEQTTEQRKVIAHYSRFSNENTDLLQGSSIQAFEPEHQYPYVFVNNEYQEIHVFYGSYSPIELNDKDITIINGSYQSKFYVQSNEERDGTVFNCMGERTSVVTINKGFNCINIPPGGMLKIPSIKLK